MQDKVGLARVVALEALAENWADDTTRKLLTERAVQDENEYTRRAAIEALAEKWADETTRKLLAQRAVDATLSADQRAEYRVTLGKLHSNFGRIVFTFDLDGIRPYLDLTKPISNDHIERAARKAGIPARRIDETVRSLSKHMGWDITKGAGK